MLEIRNITKVYGSGKNSFKALDKVSINFGAKGLVVILGKSGCGKSTLLNILGGLDKQTGGEVLINGQSTRTFRGSDFDAYRNTYVGIVFQEFNLIDEISVFDNINMTLKLQEKSADVNTVDEALAMVGLSNMGYRKPGELSGGQRQRVALARALLKKPEIILADEPTGALDSSTSEEVFESLKKISETKLVVVVTHNRDLAHTYGDRIIEIVDGKITSDRTRTVGASENVKELSPQVLQVSSGGSVEKSDIVKKIDKKRVSYIGISHDKDRVALAYPETFDSFYATVDSAVYQTTNAEEIPSDNKPFKLSKGRLPLKEAVKMARSSIKQRKKRYRLLTFLTIACFTFICLSFIIATLNVPSLVSKTAFEADGQPLVLAAKYNSNSYQRSKLSDSDYEALANAGIDVYGKVLQFSSASPVYADTADNSKDYYYNGDYNFYDSDFDLPGFTGVIEGVVPSELGIAMIAGEEKLESNYDVIISDMSAYQMMHSGFVGYSVSGEYGVHFPVSESDLIGSRFLMSKTGQYYRITGIYRTDYADYRSTITATQMDTNANKMRETLKANKFFMYSKIFAREGFGKAFNDGAASNSGGLSIGLTVNDENGYRYTNMSVRQDSLAYDSSNYTVDANTYDKNLLIWTENGGTDNPAVPSELAENEFIVSTYMLGSMLDKYNFRDIAAEKAFVNEENTQALIQAAIQLEVRDSSYVNLKTINNAKIVGVVTSAFGYYENFVASQSFVNSLTDSQVSYDYAMFAKGATRSGLQSKLDSLDKAGFALGAAKAGYAQMRELSTTLDIMSQVFLYVSLGFMVFALLIILNFMSSSIRFRTKEIAVYRVVGAKSFDVAKIFLAEGAFITVRTTIVATILSFLLTLLLNTLLASIIGMFEISITLLRFNWLIHPALILVATAVFVLVSSIVPILGITGKKPIDAVKMI